jgi:hypothetical protein
LSEAWIPHLSGARRRDGYECYALSFDYGQRHRVELSRCPPRGRIFSVRASTAHGAHRLRAFGASA